MHPSLIVANSNDILNHRYLTEWFDHPELVAEASDRHDYNYNQCVQALRYHNSFDRKLEVLLIHGSGRSSDQSSAHEPSNSQLFLRKAADVIENDEGVTITEVPLRNFNIEPCNGCVSTSSMLCGFPCNCFPFDPMQKLYPALLMADVLLISSGVNQATMASRLKLMIDRMVSLDGGMPVKEGEFEVKTKQHRDLAVAVAESAAGNIPYSQRLFGRVAAYFLSSKDQNNPDDKKFNYLYHTAKTLKKGMEDFGLFHAKNWYAGVAGHWDEDYSRDKDRLITDDSALENARKVVADAVALARRLRHMPPEPGPKMVNRT